MARQGEARPGSARRGNVRQGKEGKAVKAVFPIYLTTND